MNQDIVTRNGYWYRQLALAKTSKNQLRALAKDVANAIANQKTDAVEGAKVIWCVWERLNKPEDLSPYVAWASEMRDYSFLLKYREKEDFKTLTRIVRNQKECRSDIINYSINLQSKY